MWSIAPDSASLDHRPDRFTLEALSGVLHPGWVREAIARCGQPSQRLRKLPTRLTLWVVILMGLFRRHSYVNLLGLLFEAGRSRSLWAHHAGPPSSSALSKARDRLGVEPLRYLFAKSAREWVGVTQALDFHGRRIQAMDGSTMRVPDTPANEAWFGRPGSSRGRTSHPQLRIVTLRDVGTRLVRAAAFGPCRHGEIHYAKKVLTEVDPGTLLILDRYFVSYAFLWDLHQRGVDFVVRLKRNSRCEVLEELAPGDEIVRMHLHRGVLRKRPDLPSTWILRRTTYRPLQGSESITLLSTLQLAEEIDAAEIAALYPERWQEEEGYKELKAHLCATTTITHPTAVRSKTPERIEQELFGILTAYNAVRAIMARAATSEALPGPILPRRLSFLHALERTREATRDMIRAATGRLLERYEQLLEAIARVVVPQRPGRQYPRAVKRRLSNYPLKLPIAEVPSG